MSHPIPGHDYGENEINIEVVQPEVLSDSLIKTIKKAAELLNCTPSLLTHLVKIGYYQGVQKGTSQFSEAFSEAMQKYLK